MKKIWLLISLLVCGLLLTGCNNSEYSEYGLLQWPNGIITLDNFKKEGNIMNESELEFGIEKFCGESPETACVPVILKENEILVTPHEYNEFIAEETDLQLLDYRYYTDLKTFRKVTGLKEASPEYVENLDGVYLFDPYTKFYQTREERGAKNEPKIVDEIVEEKENGENIPQCNDIDINWDAEIINIDDVVENCTYQEGTAYSWDKGGCGGLMPQLYITKDKLGMFDLSDTKELCKSIRAGIIRDLGGHYEDINTFVYKHGLYKKGLIDSILPQTEEKINGNKCGFYYCDDENLCSQFYRSSYGENENHYYIYGYRYPKEFPYEVMLVVDDKLYRLGENEVMSETGWPDTRKQGRWIVYGLDGDKLIVKRYVDGELIPPYTLDNFNSYSFDEKTTTTKFKIKTCEIVL